MDGFMEDLEIGDDDGRYVRIICDLIREKPIKAVRAAKIHLTVFTLRRCSQCELITLQTVCNVIILECFIQRIFVLSQRFPSSSSKIA